jgi:hypothetical protein
MASMGRPPTDEEDRGTTAFNLGRAGRCVKTPALRADARQPVLGFQSLSFSSMM